MQDLGERLKALRNEQGLTLVQLGQRVGLSASYLSQIERGVAMPSLPRLATIARALDVEVAYFFEDDVSSPYPIRSNQSRRLKGTADAVVELMSADLPGGKIQPYRLVCQPGASRQHPPTHPGEVCGFVIQGQLTVTVGEETFVLKAGDSIHYEMLQPHSWRNEGSEEGIAIWAVSPPIPDGDLGG